MYVQLTNISLMSSAPPLDVLARAYLNLHVWADQFVSNDKSIIRKRVQPETFN